MKQQGINCEMAREFAKDVVWERNFSVLQDQIYVFGEQQHRLRRLKGKVDYIITDSPLLLSLFYGKHLSEAFKTLVLEEHHRYDNINIYLNRVKPYNPNGRTQTEEEAQAVDVAIGDILDSNLIDYQEVVADKTAAQIILSRVLSDKISNEKQI